MHDLLAMMDLGRRWQVGDRDPVRHWSKGRVVLIGDAAHPPLQSLAQGACMAIEDGLCLGELIHAADGDFAGRLPPLRSGPAFCAPRACSWSRARSGTSTTPRALPGTCATQTWRGWDEAHMYRCLAWLYDGFKAS